MNVTRVGSTPSSLAGHGLEWRMHAVWTRPSWALFDGDQLLLTLRRRHWYAHGMLIEVDGVTWRLGGWKTSTLTPTGADRPTLSRTGLFWHANETTERLGLSRWRGDAPIERADGRRWYWRQHGFVRDRYWEVLDEGGHALARFTRHHRPFRIEGTVRVGDEVDSRADALEAVVFGWYLLLRESAQRSHAH